MIATNTDAKARQPEARPRAIFASSDFELLRKALRQYAGHCADPGEARQCANLLHRLGRANWKG